MFGPILVATSLAACRTGPPCRGPERAPPARDTAGADRHVGILWGDPRPGEPMEAHPYGDVSGTLPGGISVDLVRSRSNAAVSSGRLSVDQLDARARRSLEALSTSRGLRLRRWSDYMAGEGWALEGTGPSEEVRIQLGSFDRALWIGVESTFGEETPLGAAAVVRWIAEDIARGGAPDAPR